MQNLFRNSYFVGSLIGLLVGVGVVFLLLQQKGSLPLVGELGGGEQGPAAGGNGDQGALPTGEFAGETITPVAPGSSGVSEEGRVVNPTGVAADNTAPPGSAEAPQQSRPLSESEIPKQALKIKAVRSEGFNPNSFSVKPGQAVTLSVTSGDQYTYVFKFTDPALHGVAVGISGGETRSITFNAPTKKGEYEFYSDVPGHKEGGMVGKMIVE